jgi:hypothetical protein
MLMAASIEELTSWLAAFLVHRSRSLEGSLGRTTNAISFQKPSD